MSTSLAISHNFNLLSTFRKSRILLPISEVMASTGSQNVQNVQSLLFQQDCSENFEITCKRFENQLNDASSSYMKKIVVITFGVLYVVANARLIHGYEMVQ